MLKLGRVRVKLTPNPFAAAGPFTQTLKLETGEIQIRSAAKAARASGWTRTTPLSIWKSRPKDPVQLEAKSELWRTNSYHLDQQAVQQAGFFEWGNDPDGLDFDPDTVLPAQNNRVCLVSFQFPQHLSVGF